MKNWKKNIVNFETSIRDAMCIINELGGRGLFVVDENLKLLGSVTDGDIRRALIRGVSLSESVSEAMKSNSFFVKDDVSDFIKKEILEKNHIQAIPVVNGSMEIVDIFSIDKLRDYSQIQVIILAGGMGTRLGKITENLPKPMVEIAGVPILERIIRKLTEQGLFDINISVNYRAEIIEEYFKEGKNFGCNISYLKEDKRLGTAGPLSLLKSNGNPIVVMNGDLLTHVDISKLIDFHQSHKASVTMCTRNHEIQVPFGVIRLENGYARTFSEKPIYNFNVNAGIYVINPEVLNLIPLNEYYDMSNLLNKLLEDGKDEVACFPVIEGWIDVGREDDLRVAQEQYSKKGN